MRSSEKNGMEFEFEGKNYHVVGDVIESSSGSRFFADAVDAEGNERFVEWDTHRSWSLLRHLAYAEMRGEEKHIIYFQRSLRQLAYAGERRGFDSKTDEILIARWRNGNTIDESDVSITLDESDVSLACPWDNPYSLEEPWNFEQANS